MQLLYFTTTVPDKFIQPGVRGTVLYRASGFSYLFKLQTSDSTIGSNEYNRLFLLNAHLHYMSSTYKIRVTWIW